MDPQDNKQLALRKAISAHEQAAAALTDLMTGPSEARLTEMLARLKQNLADLQVEAAGTDPEDPV